MQPAVLPLIAIPLIAEYPFNFPIHSQISLLIRTTLLFQILMVVQHPIRQPLHHLLLFRSIQLPVPLHPVVELIMAPLQLMQAEERARFNIPATRLLNVAPA